MSADARHWACACAWFSYVVPHIVHDGGTTHLAIWQSRSKKLRIQPTNTNAEPGHTWLESSALESSEDTKADGGASESTRSSSRYKRWTLSAWLVEAIEKKEGSAIWGGLKDVLDSNWVREVGEERHSGKKKQNEQRHMGCVLGKTAIWTKCRKRKNWETGLDGVLFDKSPILARLGSTSGHGNGFWGFWGIWRRKTSKWLTAISTLIHPSFFPTSP